MTKIYNKARRRHLRCRRFNGRPTDHRFVWSCTNPAGVDDRSLTNGRHWFNPSIAHHRTSRIPGGPSCLANSGIPCDACAIPVRKGHDQPAETRGGWSDQGRSGPTLRSEVGRFRAGFWARAVQRPEARGRLPSRDVPAARKGRGYRLVGGSRCSRDRRVLRVQRADAAPVRVQTTVCPRHSLSVCAPLAARTGLSSCEMMTTACSQAVCRCAPSMSCSPSPNATPPRLRSGEWSGSR